MKTNEEIIRIIEEKLGAKGGKILGAGGGGFMLIYADPKAQEKIKKELRRYKPFNVKIATEGSKAQEV